VSVLLVSICFVCVAVFCLCVVRKHMKPALLSTRGTREEMESVISADDIRRRCHDDASAQWEIKIVTDDNDHELDHDDLDHDLETETCTQSEAGPPSPDRTRSRNASRASNRSNRSRKGKSSKKNRSGRNKRGRKGYASVDVEAEVEADERGNMGDTLEVLNFPSFKSSVSPPSKELSILNKKINMKDVRPAFYVPGMSSHASLSSPPIPPQPHQRRLEMVPKVRERDEHLGDDCHESVAPSSAVSALSEVTASTHCLQMSEERRKDTNLSSAWNESAEDAKLCGGDERRVSEVSGTSTGL